jgi:PAS domain S-box-containing protein
MQEKILLVDDEEGIRKVLGISLEDAGYQVLAAADGRQALDLFHQHTPPIVLTDIKMPVMDGIDLLKQIKQVNRDTEVIMLTGHGDMDLAIECLKLEATDFITKPIRDDLLEIALMRAKDKIRMRRQLAEYTQHLERMVEEKSARLLEAERLAAVGQAVEGLSAAFKDLAGGLDSDIRFFNELPCLVAVHNRELKIIAANQLYRQRLGEPIGQKSFSVYVAPDNDEATCPVAETFASGRGQRRKCAVRLPDGTQVPVMVHTAPIRASTGNIELVLEIVADMGEVKRLAEELRTTQQRYQQLFDEAPCYITVQDRQFRISAANKMFLQDFELSKGARCFHAYRKMAQACQPCPVARSFEDGQAHQCEMTVTAKDGQQHHLLVWTAPLRDVHGRITHVMEMSTNITRVRQLQDQLSSLGLLIGSVSHGIKGLLTGLDGGIYLLDSGFAKDNPAQIKEGWETVRFMMGRIRRMVLDILHYAKQADLKLVQTDVIQMAREVVATVEPKARKLGIAFKCQFDAQLGHFQVDAGILSSSLSNVLENAIEACAADPADKRHQIDFRVHGRGEFIEFEVSDNGIGMDADTRAKLFTPFYTSKGSRGHGLGLYISNKLLRQHGGDMQVASQLGRGARFSITVPKKPPQLVLHPSGNNVAGHRP